MAIAQANIEYDGKIVQTTASFGLAQYRPGDSHDTLLSRADHALYAAKDAGRNQVVAG